MLPSLQTVQAEPHALAPMSAGASVQWAQLLPLGAVRGKDGRGPFRVEDAEAIIAASLQHKNTDKLPIDYDHAIDLAAPQGRPAPAAGWISRMEARPDGIWGLIEWTSKAANAVAEKEYRFLSPVLMHTADLTVKAIARASLTNNPNLTLKSLNAAQKGVPMDLETLLAELRPVLGLPADADASAVIAGAKLSKSTHSADPSQFVPIAVFQETVAELNKLRTGVTQEAAERTVQQLMASGKIMPFMKDWAISLCQSNAAAFEGFVDKIGPATSQLFGTLDWSAQHAADRQGREGGQVTEVHQHLGHSAEDIKKFGERAE